MTSEPSLLLSFIYDQVVDYFLEGDDAKLYFIVIYSASFTFLTDDDAFSLSRLTTT